MWTKNNKPVTAIKLNDEWITAPTMAQYLSAGCVLQPDTPSIPEECELYGSATSVVVSGYDTSKGRATYWTSNTLAPTSSLYWLSDASSGNYILYTSGVNINTNLFGLPNSTTLSGNVTVVMSGGTTANVGFGAAQRQPSGIDGNLNITLVDHTCNNRTYGIMGGSVDGDITLYAKNCVVKSDFEPFFINYTSATYSQSTIGRVTVALDNVSIPDTFTLYLGGVTNTPKVFDSPVLSTGDIDVMLNCSGGTRVFAGGFTSATAQYGKITTIVTGGSCATVEATGNGIFGGVAVFGVPSGAVSATVDAVEMTVKDGDTYYVYGGGFPQAASGVPTSCYPWHTVTSDVIVNIEGGTCSGVCGFGTEAQGGGTAYVGGDIKINILGGEITESVHAGPRHVSTDHAGFEFMGGSAVVTVAGSSDYPCVFNGCSGTNQLDGTPLDSICFSDYQGNLTGSVCGYAYIGFKGNTTFNRGGSTCVFSNNSPDFICDITRRDINYASAAVIETFPEASDIAEFGINIVVNPHAAVTGSWCICNIPNAYDSSIHYVVRDDQGNELLSCYTGDTPDIPVISGGLFNGWTLTRTHNGGVTTTWFERP